MFVCEKPFPGFGEGFLCIGKKTLRATGRQNVGAQGRRADVGRTSGGRRAGVRTQGRQNAGASERRGVRTQGRQNAYTHA